jgi:hypothetical protein
MNHMQIRIRCITLLALLCLAIPAFGQDTKGGIFISSVYVNNNSKTVFSDELNGKLTGWQITRPRVEILQVGEKPATYCLYMNREHDMNTYANHKIACTDVGALEVGAYVYVPGPEGQWEYNHNGYGRTRIDLRTANGEHWFYIGIDHYNRERGCRVTLVYSKPEEHRRCGDADTYSTQGSVFSTNKWVLVSFKLDPDKKTATVYVDGRAQVSSEYDPSRITNLQYLDLTTWMGDKECTQQPGQCINP